MSETRTKQVRSDNDASELDIFGHLGTFWATLGQFGRPVNEFGAFRLLSYSFPTIFGSSKRMRYVPTDRPYYRDAWTHLKKESTRTFYLSKLLASFFWKLPSSKKWVSLALFICLLTLVAELFPANRERDGAVCFDLIGRLFWRYCQIQ